MLGLVILVLGGSALVLGRLSSGARVDLTRLSMNVLDIRNESSGDSGEDPLPAARQDSGNPGTQPTAAPAREQTETVAAPAEFSLTVGGSLAFSGEVRKNSWNSDTGVADYGDMMMLLQHRISGDVNLLFLENIISDSRKATDTVAPAKAAALIREAGFTGAACGFAQSYALGREGIEDTLKAMTLQNLQALGIQYAGESEIPEIRKVNGMKAAFLQYTDTIAAKTRKTMTRDGTESMVPAADLTQIAAEIGAAREAGAEAVIVLVNWGKTAKDPDKAQRALAAGIAQAGADLIIGNGSHVPQGAEYLEGRNGSVLCVWCPGTLVTGDRSNIRRMSGYLFHVTIRSNGRGGADVISPEYTPVYTWKYRQDGRYYYRCIPSAGTEPDGMDSEQRKAMERSAETVRTVLADSPLAERSWNDEP